MDLQQILLDAGLNVDCMNDATKQKVLQTLSISLYDRVGFRLAEEVDEQVLAEFNRLIEEESPKAFVVLGQAVPNLEQIINEVAKELVDEYNFIQS